MVQQSTIGKVDPDIPEVIGLMTDFVEHKLVDFIKKVVTSVSGVEILWDRSRLML